MPRIAAIQMNSGDDVNQNLDLTRGLIANARDGGALLAVLPECFALMAKDHTQRLECAEPADRPGPIERCLSELAAEFQIWIVAAGIFFHCGDQGKVRNTTLLFNSLGACIRRYDKLNLFDLKLPGGERYSESDYTESGNEVVAVDTPVGKSGLTVCYDVRFPRLYHDLVSMGAVWFAVPSAFAYTTGKDHWEILLRARAIENHAYVVAPAQWGEHSGGRRTWGNSMVVDPWGAVVAHQTEGDGVLFAEIDLEEVNSVRTRFSKS